MKKLLACFGLLLFTVSCATHKVETKNPANVTFNFQSNGKSALTFWRKLNPDGSKGKVFSVGGNSKGALMMNSGFREPYSETLKLDAGTYYLDSYQLAQDGSFIVSEVKHYLLRNGWNKKKNKPYYLMFEVEEGENLVLPEVEFVTVDNDLGEFLVKFKFEDRRKIFTVGEKVKKQTATGTILRR